MQYSNSFFFSAILHHNCSTLLTSSVSPVNALYYPQHSSPRLTEQDQPLHQQQETDKFTTESHDISDFVTYVCQDAGSTTLENATFHPHPHQLAPHSHSLTHHTSPHYHQIHQQLRGAKLPAGPQATPYHNTMLPPMLPPMARPVAIIRTSGDLSMVQSGDKGNHIDEVSRNEATTIGGNNSPIESDAADSIASSECTTLIARTSPQPHTQAQNLPHSATSLQSVTQTARCKMPTIASNSLARIANQMYPSANGREYFNHFHTQSTPVSIS